MSAHWQAVAHTGDIDEGQMKAVTLDGHRCLVVLAEGRYYVIDEMCSHEDYSLALGCIKDSRIKCSLHGSYFDLATGAALDEPADEPIRSYPVKVEADTIWADFG